MILSVGEILVDMIGVKRDDAFVYERKAGGAPFNVACAVKKLGGDSAFVGSVGDDIIGKFLVGYAHGCGIEAYIPACAHNTTLAFVELDEKGEREFCFYRHDTADFHLPEISESLLERTDIIHIGSLMLSEEVGRKYAKALIECAHKKGKKVSFDVNFRSDIFRDVETAKKIYLQFIKLADIIKFSEEEAEMFNASAFGVKGDKKLVCITKGSNGSTAVYDGEEYNVPSIKVKPVDTTGAGDAFFGGLLCMLDGKQSYDGQTIVRALKVANMCGALNTQTRGAIDGLPSMEQVVRALSNADVRL